MKGRKVPITFIGVPSLNAASTQETPLWNGGMTGDRPEAFSETAPAVAIALEAWILKGPSLRLAADRSVGSAAQPAARRVLRSLK
jgi:hypothetical protein